MTNKNNKIDLSFTLLPHPYLDDVYHMRFQNQYAICSTLIRIQEFYESPDTQIKNNVASLIDIMDSYAKRNNKFDYLEQWNAFNIPGSIIRKFFVLNKSLTKREQLFKDALNKINPQLLNSKNEFYVIATYKCKDEKSDFNHETAHALFCLDINYRKEMIEHVSKCSNFKLLKRYLLKYGYEPCVINDEIQAYLGTSSMLYLKNEFHIRKPEVVSSPFRKTFNRYRRQYVKQKRLDNKKSL